jgi:serine/threonine-protein kinase HipA
MEFGCRLFVMGPKCSCCSIFSVDLAAPAYVNRHSLSVNGKYEQITREDLEIIGQNNDIQNYKSLIDKVANAISGFGTYAREEKLNAGLIDDIRKEFPD